MRRPRREEEAPERRTVSPRGSHAGFSVLGPIGTDTLRVIPLGGVGEVGKNMTVVECGQDIVLLDAGGKFPEEDQRGIDLIIPDINFITERLNNFRGILITHGHEDHIGALPYIIPQLREFKGKIPIYGTPLAMGFVERKLLEARLEQEVELHTIEGGDTVTFGSISAEFIHVTHSIPDACAIALHTPVGTIVDTGDFKFDPTPVMGGPTDEKRLRRIGNEGVLALFSDTVRVETAGSTPSEKVVHDKLDEEIGKSKGQVIIATFASNISRIYMALHAAEKHGRKVAVAGRSMEQNAKVALELGYLDPPDGIFVTLEEILRMPKEKRVIVSTGSQGEVAAALARIGAGEHPKIRVARGDTVIVSASPIPGNEETVSNTINNLFRLGADVIYSALDRGVHVSGHGGRDELQKMIQLLNPRYVVPIHGEYRHMSLYRDLAAETGIRRDHVLLPEIGGVIEFTKNNASQKGRVKSGNILVDRLGDRDGGQTVLRTRENLTEDGFVVVTVVLDRQSGELIAGPDLIAKGLSKELNGALGEAERELRRMLDRRKQGSPQYGYVVQRAKETVAKVLYRRTRTRPLILPIVTEL
jgi:ribonuclease J